MLRKKAISSIKVRFISYSFATISSTAFLKVFLSIPHKVEGSFENIEAERGALYKRANSPKPSPTDISLFTLP